MTPAAQHRAIADRFTSLVRSVGDQWDRPTPVAEWAVRDIVRHLVEWFPAFLAASSAVRLPVGPSVDDDPVAAWEVHSNAVQAVLDDPATEHEVLTDPHIGQLPLAEAIDQFYTADVFMHTWDLARATRQDDHLDDNTCAAMLTGMLPLDQMLRDSGHYGPRMPVDNDASAGEQLMAFIGRDPAWRPAARSGN